MIRKCNFVREIQSRSTILTYLIDLIGLIRQQCLPIWTDSMGIHYNIKLDLSFSIAWISFSMTGYTLLAASLFLLGSFVPYLKKLLFYTPWNTFLFVCFQILNRKMPMFLKFVVYKYESIVSLIVQTKRQHKETKQCSTTKWERN